MDRTLFTEEHDAFRKAFRQFADREIIPHQARWREAGQVDREVWRKAGKAGFLCPWVEEKYGGAGSDFLASTVIIEELARMYESGFAMALHSDVVVPYIATFGNDEQKQRWLPGCVSGDLITAIGMTEPGAGSDLAALQTSAVKDGDDYIINGSKTFISNGQLCDLVLLAAKTDPDPKNAHRGISLFVVEATRKGFIKGKRLHKMGLASQDTSELFFEDCRVPVANRLGGEGEGFYQIMGNFEWERISLALGAVGAGDAILEDVMKYVRDRKAFGKSVGEFQVVRHRIAEMATDLECARQLTYHALKLHAAGEYALGQTAMAKKVATEMCCRLADQSLQLHGGAGYMMEFDVQRHWRDARLGPIGGGTSEIMNEIIAKQLGF
jgi:acyl-CoA dehydrogenase